MSREDWYKKDVPLQWRGMTLSLAVSQALFSSHTVDVGTRLLLKSLRPDELAASGSALDFGCGYGVLGLAWKSVKPGWTVHLVDRDALAVEFSAWNAERLDLDPGKSVACAVGLGPEGASPDGFDLILWNVPGKAGAAVLRRLAADVADALGTGGLAALVIVNPLAALVRSEYEGRPDLHITLDEESSDHTVLHIIRKAGAEPGAEPLEGWTGPFERGVFDREPRTFVTLAGTYTMTPVVGLPEYESLSHETVLMVAALRDLERSPESLLVFGCGQGHVPVAAHMTGGTSSYTLIDRDLLALKAAARSLKEVGVPQGSVRSLASPEIGPMSLGAAPVEAAVVRLDDQLPPAVMMALARDLEAVSPGELPVLAAGGSTSVSRLLAIVRKRAGWKLRARSRKHGASTAVLTVG